jgi:hypothetical protein
MFPPATPEILDPIPIPTTLITSMINIVIPIPIALAGPSMRKKRAAGLI